VAVALTAKVVPFHHSREKRRIDLEMRLRLMFDLILCLIVRLLEQCRVDRLRFDDSELSVFPPW